jgi:ATP-dependent Lhr-like helicase
MSVDRRLLPLTFGPWFGRFDALTRVQEEAIPMILAGRDTLVCSATASGKTEAYAAPAAERAHHHGNAPATVLIVCPTRALANDLKRRLEGPMALVEVPFGRYTGEHKERTAGRMRAVSIVTPEALDSLLVRRSRALANVRLVIVDEVHVVDGTPRGDHLRVLLHRLSSVARHPVQRVAVSATVDDPAALAARYLGPEPALVVVPGARRLVGKGFDQRSPEAMRAHLDTLAAGGLRKVLVFCKSRNLVETLAAKLARRTRFGDAVFAHHGSLAKIERERTERQFLAASSGVCFATLTLEMGIDIGTVDYVLLADVPSDVASFLQRIGRGGRRGDTTRFGYVVADAGEEHVLRTMVSLGKEGLLAARPYGFRPSVFVQQALGLACAAGYVEAQDVDALVPPALAAELGPRFGARLLESMHEAALLERARGGRYVPLEAHEQRFARGEMHSNFEDVAAFEVVDRITGDVVGHVEALDSRRVELGGRDRNVAHQSGARILTDAGRDGQPARFRPNAAPSVSFAFGRAVVEGLGVAPGELAIVAEAGELRLVHGCGTVGALLLDEVLTRAGASPNDSGAYTTSIARAPEALPSLGPEELCAFVQAHVGRLARLVAAGPWRRGLPFDVHLAAVERASGLQEVAEWLGRATIKKVDTLQAAWRELD